MINKVFLNSITIELRIMNLHFRGGGATRMKIHRNAKICRHTKGLYIGTQLIHEPNPDIQIRATTKPSLLYNQLKITLLMWK